MDPKWHHMGFLEMGGSVTASGERSGNIYESRDSVWGNICLSPAFVRPAVVCGAEARSEKKQSRSERRTQGSEPNPAPPAAVYCRVLCVHCIYCLVLSN